MKPGRLWVVAVGMSAALLCASCFSDVSDVAELECTTNAKCNLGLVNGGGRCVDGACEFTACASAEDCDDGLVCTGEESCQPDAEGADARGCVGGVSQEGKTVFEGAWS